MNYKKIIDISLPIHESMPIYPNNPAVIFESLRTKHSFLTKMTLGSHTGTHLDVPRHVFEEGKGVDQIALEQLVGSCRVLNMTHIEFGSGIGAADVEKENIQQGERILVKTKNSIRYFDSAQHRGLDKFYDDYIYCEPEAAEFLAAKEILLFGIDSLSVKKKGSDDNRPHTVLLEKGTVIFEGLDLSQVEAGSYTFVGLPLRLVALDGAPARVVLLSN